MKHLSLLLFAGLLVAPLSARVLSVNIAPNSAGNAAIDGDETFGVPDLETVVGNWNNIRSSTSDLFWSDGTASTIGVDLTAPNQFDYFGAVYINTPINYGADHYGGTNDDPGTSLTLFNMNTNCPDGYYVIVYFNGFQGNQGGSIAGASRTFYFNPRKPLPTTFGPEDLERTTSRSEPLPDQGPTAQYAVFGSPEIPLTADSETFRIDVLAGGGVALCGLQVVPLGDAGAELEDLTGTFYLDAAAGNDDNDGTSPATAWQTLSRLNRVRFGAGSNVLFKRGDVFPGRFQLHGTGTPESPIIFAAYGEGAKPRLEGAEGDLEVVFVANGEGLEFRDLEVSNHHPAGTLANRNGIRLSLGPGAGEMEHIVFENVDFKMIEGSGTDHESRGIMASTSDAADLEPLTRWNGFRIEGCHFEDIDGRAVQLLDLDQTLADQRFRGQQYFPTVGFVFRNNTGKNCYRNQLQIRGTEGALVEHNFMEGTSEGSAFWVFDAVSTLVQFNDYRNLRNENADGFVCHFDYNCVDTLMQYNFGYDVDGGLIEVIVLSNFDFFQENAVARYNVGIDVGFRNTENAAGIMLSGRVTGTEIYNNTIVTTSAQSSYKAIAMNDWGGEYPRNSAVHNNLFLALGSTSTFDDGFRLTEAGNVASHNLYFGSISTPAFDQAPVTGDPKLADPTGGLDPANFKVTVGSAAIGAGLLLGDNGGRDFFNYPVSATEAPTIGFHEYLSDTRIDSDGDSMGDAWERQHSFDPEIAGEADVDSDGDGILNRYEYLADTDPRDPLSFLHSQVTFPDGAALGWTMRPEREYYLYLSTNLFDWSRVGDLPVSSPLPLPLSGDVFLQLQPAVVPE